AHRQRPTDRGRIEPATVPCGVTDDRDGMTARAIVGLIEEAPGQWRDPERRKVIARHKLAGERLGGAGSVLAADAQVVPERVHRRDLFEHVRAIAYVE